MDKNILKMIRKEIGGFTSNYRCHEGARVIGEKLRAAGIDVKVRDGGVIYDTSFFLKELEDFSHPFSPEDLEDLSEDEKKELDKELKGEKIKSRLAVLHSWCEVKNGIGEVIVIDWHHNLNLSPTCGIQNNLIIKKKNDLPHTYVPFGINIGKWIIFLTFPLVRATKLRF